METTAFMGVCFAEMNIPCWAGGLVHALKQWSHKSTNGLHDTVGLHFPVAAVTGEPGILETI